LQFDQLKRRKFMTLLGGTAAAWPLTARAQQPAKLPIIGFLGLSTRSAQREITDAFVQRLRELRWTEGRTVAIEYRWAEGRTEGFAAITAEFVRLKVAVIVTQGTSIVLAAKQVTSDIPIVFASAGDPLGNGLVANLARPGGNVTGLSSQSSDSVGKRFELLRAVIPNLRRLALLGNVDSSFAVLEMGEVLNRIHTFALAARLPTTASFREFVEAGALMSYGSNLPSQYRRAAEYVDKILRGAKAGDLPVEQPTKFDLIVNLTTAKALGLEVPPTLLAIADEVIE
jgi:putative ABC transport system substrate-binding protein